jgi:acyl-CoA synthetase (AMP-forming)/AMP-acid ligase II
MLNSSDLRKATSFHQIFTYHSQDTPNHVWFYYPEPVNAAHYRELTYKGTDALINHLAAQYANILPKADENTISKMAPKSISNPPMVVATLGSNTVQLLLTGLAAQRMQHAYMHISPLNSDAGILSLLKSMDAKVLIADSVFYERAESLAAQAEGVQLVRMIEFDPVDELEKDLQTFDYDKDKNEGEESFLLIHTSGTSSSAPKPVWHANNSLLGSPSTPKNQTTITCGLL